MNIAPRGKLIVGPSSASKPLETIQYFRRIYLLFMGVQIAASQYPQGKCKTVKGFSETAAAIERGSSGLLDIWRETIFCVVALTYRKCIRPT